jgi:tRNA1Val (adenine37-N6)-methyltransferase
MKMNSRLQGDDETLDTFYHGRILVLQKKKGYRFAIDAPLLAAFIRTKETDEMVELGAGNGIISLLLSTRPFRHILCLEIQESLAGLARRNVSLNKLESRIEILQADLCAFSTDKKFDVVFSNPPWVRGVEGPLGFSLEKAIAKHEIKSDIFDIMQATAGLLKTDGRAFFIYPDKRKKDLFEAADKNRLGLRRMRAVLPRQQSAANFLLAECGYGGGSAAELSPLIIFDESGRYTPEMEQIFAGEANA